MEYWKDLFREHILERGRNYYKMGMVRNIRQTEFGYHAKVDGTEEYDVLIEIKGNSIHNMLCSCPYAEDGNYCKHMAAVLYEVKEAEAGNVSETKTWEEKYHEAEQELRDLIERIPEQEVRDILMQKAQEDVSFRNHLMTKYASVISSSQMASLKNEISGIAYRYSDMSGFVDWNHATDYTDDLDDFLYDKVQMLIDKECYIQAFELTNAVFIQVVNQDIDDSAGSTSMIANACYDFWKCILDKCSDDEKQKMFQWFKSHLGDRTIIDYMEEYIRDFLMNEFHDREILEQKLELLDEMITEAEARPDFDSLSIRHEHGNNILKRLEVMRELDYSEEEIENFRADNRRFTAIRKLEIEEYLEQENITEAIGILKESKELDKEFHGLVEEYSRKLIDLYERTDRRQEYKEELLFLVFSCGQNNLKYVKKLKAICTPVDWEVYREKILNGRNRWSIKYQLLESEGMYERLLMEINKSSSIYDLDQYEKVLKKQLPELVRDAYAAYVRREVERAAKRSHYKSLARYLKKIQSYPGGKEIAAEIAQKWKLSYPRRPAMMEELKKAGF